MDTTPFFIFLFVHLSSLILAFGSVMVTDIYGLLWMRSRVSLAQVIQVGGITEKLIWIGWTGMVVSGIPQTLLKGKVDNLMILKLFFVFLVGLNGVPLHFIHKSFKKIQDSEVVPKLSLFRIGLSSAVSQIGWWGAFLIGFLHRHVNHVIEWPARPWLWSAVILLVLLAVWGAGEVLFRYEDRTGHR